MGIKDLQIAVLMGGPSGEHDISLKSGGGVSTALRSLGYRVNEVLIARNISHEDACRWTKEQLEAVRPDVVFIALHGPFGEDGVVQQLCADLGLPFTGSDASASQKGMDKWLARQFLSKAGLELPEAYLLNPEEPDAGLPSDLRFPVVVKPPNQGSSLGVSIVKSEHEFPEALRLAGQYDSRVIVEAFVPGREVTAGVVGKQVLPVIEIVPGEPFFDFKAKYTKGCTRYDIPASLPEEVSDRIRAAAQTAHRALGCRHLSRTDFILAENGRPIVLEVNTVPGFTPTSLIPMAAQSVGLSYENICDRLVKMAYADRLVGVSSHA